MVGILPSFFGRTSQKKRPVDHPTSNTFSKLSVWDQNILPPGQPALNQPEVNSLPPHCYHSFFSIQSRDALRSIPDSGTQSFPSQITPPSPLTSLTLLCFHFPLLCFSGSFDFTSLCFHFTLLSLLLSFHFPLLFRLIRFTFALIFRLFCFHFPLLSLLFGFHFPLVCFSGCFAFTPFAFT